VLYNDIIKFQICIVYYCPHCNAAFRLITTRKEIPISMQYCISLDISRPIALLYPDMITKFIVANFVLGCLSSTFMTPTYC